MQLQTVSTLQQLYKKKTQPPPPPPPNKTKTKKKNKQTKQKTAPCVDYIVCGQAHCPPPPPPQASSGAYYMTLPYNFHINLHTPDILKLNYRYGNKLLSCQF